MQTLSLSLILNTNCCPMLHRGNRATGSKLFEYILPLHLTACSGLLAQNTYRVLQKSAEKGITRQDMFTLVQKVRNFCTFSQYPFSLRFLKTPCMHGLHNFSRKQSFNSIFQKLLKYSSVPKLHKVRVLLPHCAQGMCFKWLDSSTEHSA